MIVTVMILMVMAMTMVMLMLMLMLMLLLYLYLYFLEGGVIRAMVYSDQEFKRREAIWRCLVALHSKWHSIALHSKWVRTTLVSSERKRHHWNISKILKFEPFKKIDICPDIVAQQI